MRPGGRSMLADLVIGWRKIWAGGAREREPSEREEIRRRLNTEARRRTGRDECLGKQLLARAKQLLARAKQLNCDYLEAE